MSKKQHLNRTQRTADAVLIQRIDIAESFRGLPFSDSSREIVDHKMNYEEPIKRPLPIPFPLQKPPSRTMNTSLDEHLRFIAFACAEGLWSAKDNSDWDLLVRFLKMKCPPVNPAVPIDALRDSLSKAATEIAAATAALDNMAPLDAAHAGWPLPDARSAHPESPLRNYNRATQGISPSPKRTKAATLPDKLYKLKTKRAKELLADYYPANVLERTMLVPYKEKFSAPYLNLPWAITVYGAVYKDTPNLATMLRHAQAVSAAQAACARYGATYATHNVHSIIAHIASHLRLPIRPCPENSDTAAIAAATAELILLAYKIEKRTAVRHPISISSLSAPDQCLSSHWSNTPLVPLSAKKSTGIFGLIIKPVSSTVSSTISAHKNGTPQLLSALGKSSPVSLSTHTRPDYIP